MATAPGGGGPNLAQQGAWFVIRQIIGRIAAGALGLAGAIGGILGGILGMRSDTPIPPSDAADTNNPPAPPAPAEPPSPTQEAPTQEGAGPEDDGGCFSGETPVLMADGTLRRIDCVVVGDEILSCHENDAGCGIVQPCRVDRVFCHSVTETIRVETAAQIPITTTKQHCFFVQGRGFVPARQLERGVVLVSQKDLNGFEVRELTVQPGVMIVYNLAVDICHTYFVGNDCLLVHNVKRSNPEEVPGEPVPPVGDE